MLPYPGYGMRPQKARNWLFILEIPGKTVCQCLYWVVRFAGCRTRRGGAWNVNCRALEAVAFVFSTP